jgi:hypothetical protein
VIAPWRFLPAQRPKREESDSLPHPDILGRELVEDVNVALEQFRETANDLSKIRH